MTRQKRKDILSDLSREVDNLTARIRDGVEFSLREFIEYNRASSDESLMEASSLISDLRVLVINALKELDIEK